MIHRFRTQFMAKLKTKPAKLMTEEEYAEGFEQMKKEAAPLQYLITHDFGNLPRELRFACATSGQFDLAKTRI